MDLQLTATRAFIEEADEFLLTTHVNSDADGIGACMAWAHLLRGLGKRADIGLPEPPAGQCSFLAGWDGVRHFADLDLNRYRCAIIADCPSLDRIGPVRPSLSSDIRLLNIDHHQDNECFGAVNIVEEVSSTASFSTISPVASAMRSMPSPPPSSMREFSSIPAAFASR